MRRRWGSLAVVLLVGCAHTASPPRSAPAAEAQVPEALAAWMAYALALSTTGDQIGHDDLGREVSARELLADGWKKSRAKKPVKDPYLNLLADVRDASLMREYVLAYLAHPGWTVTASDLARLDFDRWEKWRPSHLPPDHEAMTPVKITGLPEIAVPGSDLPGPEIDPAQSSCRAVRPALERALAAWQRQERALAPLPLSIQLQDQIMPAFRQAVRSPRAQRNGVVLVSPQALNVVFLEGFCGVDRGEWAAAEPLLRRAAALSPGSSNVRAELVQALIMQKRLDQADVELDLALELPDTDCRKAVLWRKRGYILFDRGKLVDSYGAYAHSLELDAGSQLARSEMALIVKTLRAAGTYDEKALAPLVAPAVPNQMRVTKCPAQ
jgi:tetratricopeptide (TPR) repeat protein